MLQGREGVRFLGFRGGRGSVFWVSGRRGGPFSGLQGRKGDPVWGLAGSWGNALAAPGGMHRGGLHYPLFKEIE